MKKRKLLGLLSGIFLLLFCSTSFVEAATVTENASSNIEVELGKLEEKYGLEQFPITTRSAEEIPIMEFENLEQFEQFLKSLSNYSSTELELSTSESFYSTARASNTKKIEWNAYFPINIGLPLFYSKIVKFAYDYKFVNGRPQFTNVYNITSGIGGMTIAINWVHDFGIPTHYSAKYSSKDTANIKVEGHYVFGVVVGGFEVGYRLDDTWTCSLTLVP